MKVILKITSITNHQCNEIINVQNILLKHDQF